MTDEELEAIQARANAATAGPWVVGEPVERRYTRDGMDHCEGIDSPSGPVVETDSGVYPPDLPTAQFIAAARADVPALVAEVRRLKAENIVVLAPHERRARAEMKERCAKVAQEESAERNACQCGWSIAVAIRTLPEEP